MECLTVEKKVFVENGEKWKCNLVCLAWFVLQADVISVSMRFSVYVYIYIYIYIYEHIWTYILIYYNSFWYILFPSLAASKVQVSSLGRCRCQFLNFDLGYWKIKDSSQHSNPAAAAAKFEFG